MHRALGPSAAAAGAGTAGWMAVAAAIAILFLAKRSGISAGLFLAVAVLMIIAGWQDSPLVLVVSGAAVVGGITAEMMLGHWYLIDPTLPRWALQALVLAAGAGLLVDVGYLIAEGAFRWGTGDEVLGWAFIALAAMTALLMVAVALALREPFYTAVMAATGLSYLAVLTSFGAVVLGRMLAY